MVAGVLAAIMVLGIVALVSGGGGGGDVDLSTTQTTAGQTSTTDVEAAVTGPAEATPVCPPEDGSAERRTTFAVAPPMCIDDSRSYQALVETTEGSFTIDLDAEAAPLTVNNFVFLSRYHYYDGVIFHRVIPDFVVQGGDPQGTGRGGPGYRFADELPEAGAYQLGSVAMANSGVDTNGSQFFIVTGPTGVALPPNYSLFGQVTEGMEVVEAIEDLGSPGGAPREVVTIESIQITEA